MTLYLGIFAYLAITTLFVRFVQVTRERDDDMRRISAEWIEQVSGTPVSS